MRAKSKISGKIMNWLKAKSNREYLVRILIMMLLPWICVFVYCFFQKRSLADVFIPCSEWNDELFYFKQVEGMVKYGYPHGFFGYNESHALKLSFASWSPFLVIPWVIWGKLFGWTFLSPILCNITVLSLVMGAFVVLTKPNWKQEITLGVLFCLFTPFVRYLLSCTPEIFCFCVLILFYGISISEIRNEANWKIILLFCIGVLGTFMRPYLILLLFLPCFFWIKRNRWKGLLGSILVLILSMLGYALINHFLLAEYLTDVFSMDWIEVFIEQGFLRGIRYDVIKLYQMGKDFLILLYDGVRRGALPGAIFAGFSMVIVLLVLQTIIDITKKKVENVNGKEFVVAELHLIFACIGMLIALLLAYSLNDGSRHLLTFIAAGIFLISLMENKYWGKPILLGLSFIYLYILMAKTPYDYQVPFVDSERLTELEKIQEALDQTIVLQNTQIPSFDNDVIWVLGDYFTDGTYKRTTWQLLYALPEGMGISCCEKYYVSTQADSLKSKYLATVNGGELDQLFKQKDYMELFRDEELVMYQLR